MKKKLLLKLMKFSLYGLILQTMFVGVLMASGANAQRKHQGHGNRPGGHRPTIPGQTR